MKKLTTILATAALGLSIHSGAGAEGASSYPGKPVNIVVPFAAGGGSDTLARTVGQKLSEMWKQPVVVINKAGADGNIGAQLVASAPADGYTLMVLDIGTLTMGPIFYKNLPFDPATAFDPVTVLTFSPHTLVVHPSVPAKTFKELLEYSKANPDKMNFAAHNNSAALAGHRLSAETGIEMTQIPYKGAGAAMVDLMGGQVNLSLASLLLVSPQIKSGALKAIAVASPKRMASMPEIPTLMESGVPGYVMGSWQAVVAPAGVPAEIVKKINLAIAEALKGPDVKEKLEGSGAEIIANSPEEFGRLLNEQRKTFKEVAARANVQTN